jgi:hypothetical protein
MSGGHLRFVLAASGIATPMLLHHNATIQIDNASIGHGGYSGGLMEKRDETLSNLGKKKKWQQRLTVEG